MEYIDEEECAALEAQREQDDLQEEWETLMKGFGEFLDEKALERIRKESQSA